ncbi:hypothetical protein J2X32_001126 [Rheinheimera pacifica]|uniref:hypothetical protein n=1 Tax=Rheinheimera pacifica TaxID=173990 RepID=UPI00285A0CBD|nr:hypothetical protein [Rheinheimera pacifica]MDR6982508.1 hypothetical protein [Rheinheimera pacifica]
MDMDIIELVKLLLSLRKTNEEKFNSNLVSLYKEIKSCHAAYLDLEKEPESILKWEAHKKSVNNLIKIFSKFYDYLKINESHEMIADIGSYISMESFNDLTSGKDYPAMDKHVQSAIVQSGDGSFENAMRTLEKYLKENIKEKHDMFFLLNK